jgi:hypothetical protein
VCVPCPGNSQRRNSVFVHLANSSICRVQPHTMTSSLSFQAKCRTSRESEKTLDVTGNPTCAVMQPCVHAEKNIQYVSAPTCRYIRRRRVSLSTHQARLRQCDGGYGWGIEYVTDCYVHRSATPIRNVRAQYVTSTQPFLSRRCVHDDVQIRQHTDWCVPEPILLGVTVLPETCLALLLAAA